MIKALIIDDEQHCLTSLAADLAKNCSNVSVVGQCNSSKSGILAIKNLQPQLVFLDVEMPWMNGFEMLEVLPEINFSIIFTTAFDKFAARAFRISAIDYLLKPIDSADLVEAVKKASEKLSNKRGGTNIENLLKNLHSPSQFQKIALPSHDGFEFAQVDTILYCLAEGSYTRIFLKDKNPLVVSKTLGDIEEILPSEIFVRIHHSTIVNLNAISHYSRTDGGYVVINTKEKLMVSKARKDVLLQHLGLKS